MREKKTLDAAKCLDDFVRDEKYPRETGSVRQQTDSWWRSVTTWKKSPKSLSTHMPLEKRRTLRFRSRENTQAGWNEIPMRYCVACVHLPDATTQIKLIFFVTSCT